MKKILYISILMIVLLLILSLNVVANQGGESGTITVSVSGTGRNVNLTGSISSGAGKEITVLVTDSSGTIVYIDQITSGTDGEFDLTFKMPRDAAEGTYLVKIGGTGVSVPITKNFDYPFEFEYAHLTANVSIDSYIPTIQMTASTQLGKNILLSLSDGSGTTYINQTISETDGMQNITCTLPSLMSSNTYTFELKASEEISKPETLLTATLDSGVLTLGIDASYNFNECDKAVCSVSSSILNETITLSGNQTYTYSLPTVVCVGDFAFDATLYTTEYAEDNNGEDEVVYTIEGSASVGDICVFINASTNLPVGTDVDYVVKDANENVICEGLYVTWGENISFDIEVPDDEGNEEYVVTLSCEQYNASCSFSFITLERTLPPKQVERSNNVFLYNALKKARPELDFDNDGVITIEELNNIKGVLDISNRNISDIDGLQSCTSIAALYASNNKIADLKPIAYLTRVKVLVVDDNQISDIPKLPDELIKLDISGNQIISANGIAKLDELETLYADNNSIQTIGFLNKKPLLKILCMKSNNISDISYLQSSVNLRHLDLSDNNISDISALSGKQKLRDLRLSNNSITSVSMLPDNYYINLYLDGNQINVDDITGLNAVNKVYLSQN